MQAGTLSWPRVAVDDGVSATHFSYVWDAARVPQYLAQGILPEMHVWVALPDRGPEILDVTTCYLVRQARERAGLVWTAPPPPDYLWTDKAGLPEGVLYRPEMEAIVLALRLLRHPLPAAMFQR